MYANKLINYFEFSPNLVESINDFILRQIEKEEDLILKLFKYENLIGEDDIDLIEALKKLLYNIYKRNLITFYFNHD